MNVLCQMTTVTQTLPAPTLMDHFYVFVAMVILEMRRFAKVVGKQK
jgi:hypothetical protein